MKILATLPHREKTFKRACFVKLLRSPVTKTILLDFQSFPSLVVATVAAVLVLGSIFLSSAPPDCRLFNVEPSEEVSLS